MRVLIPTDEELIARWRAGCTRAIDDLVRRYEGLARDAAFAAGHDPTGWDDLRQVARISVFLAARSWEASRAVPFAAWCKRFAYCRTLTAKTRRHGKKHALVDDAVPYHLVEEWLLPEGRRCAPGPERTVLPLVLWERVREILSPLEWAILERRLEGWSYEQIGAERRIPVKTIDNALIRVRRKLSARWAWVTGDEEEERQCA